MAAYGSDTLATISQDGHVPDTRFKDARSVQDFCRRLIDNDTQRSYKRARVNGLVDGNPPYKMSKLREAGRADSANVNWGIARAYLESAVGAFYDLFSEAPNYFSVKTDFGNDEQKATYSGVISEEADRILRQDKVWDYNVQISQWGMVLHGCGPLMFEDSFRVLPRAYLCGDLKVPEFTYSDTSYWEVCMVQATYYPPELYQFISDPKQASRIGWDVDYTKKVIANAMDIRTQVGVQYDWEFYQQELKNNALMYMYDDSKINRIAHVFWREFDGGVTHVMVERDSTTGGTAAQPGDENAESSDIRFLFSHPRRYRNFQEVIHPMYYDHGNGGYHHSVTGMGVKMFSAMEYQNRLLCNLCDKAFSPKILFKPTSTEASNKFEIAHLGEYAVLPKGFDWQQTGLAGLMNDGLAMNGQLTDIIGQNLMSYRGQPMKQEGNPVTARQVQYDASQQAALSKTQFNRYYEQLDMLYAEIYRRLSNLNSNDPKAMEFQERCRKRKVPVEALNRIAKIEATRVVGQGSAFMRKQALDTLWLTVSQALGEEGRDNLLEDKIAAEAGQSAVERYHPRRADKQMPNDQEADAMLWVSAMKTGVSPKITPTQNAVIYANTWLQAAAQAAQSLQQGADPAEVYHFLHMIGPAILAQLQRFGQDKQRQALQKEMMKRWQQLAKITDGLGKQLQKQAEAQKQQAQKTQQTMTDEQLKAAKVQSDIQLKTVKTAAALKQSEERHALKQKQAQQDMALADAATASEIHRKRLKDFQE